LLQVPPHKPKQQARQWALSAAAEWALGSHSAEPMASHNDRYPKEALALLLWLRRRSDRTSRSQAVPVYSSKP
jgi:hypothetical protein